MWKRKKRKKKGEKIIRIIPNQIKKRTWCLRPWNYVRPGTTIKHAKECDKSIKHASRTLQVSLIENFHYFIQKGKTIDKKKKNRRNRHITFYPRISQSSQTNTYNILRHFHGKPEKKKGLIFVHQSTILSSQRNFQQNPATTWKISLSHRKNFPSRQLKGMEKKKKVKRKKPFERRLA